MTSGVLEVKLNREELRVCGKRNENSWSKDLFWSVIIDSGSGDYIAKDKVRDSYKTVSGIRNLKFSRSPSPFQWIQS